MVIYPHPPIRLFALQQPRHQRPTPLLGCSRDNGIKCGHEPSHAHRELSVQVRFALPRAARQDNRALFGAAELALTSSEMLYQTLQDKHQHQLGLVVRPLRRPALRVVEVLKRTRCWIVHYPSYILARDVAVANRVYELQHASWRDFEKR